MRETTGSTFPTEAPFLTQDHTKALLRVESCDDPAKLRIIIANAKKQGAFAVADAAFRRLISIVPDAKPGSLEHDFWSTVHAFEHILKEERGKTVLLNRTRQKVARVGVIQTLADWALDSKETEGFKMLLERQLPDLTGEAFVLRHKQRFEPLVVDAARARLKASGIDSD